MTSCLNLSLQQRKRTQQEQTELTEESLRFDILVEDFVPVEAKAVEKVLPIHKAQLLFPRVHKPRAVVSSSPSQGED
jgi:hypothetical protein